MIGRAADNGGNALPWGEVTAVSCFLLLGLDSHPWLCSSTLYLVQPLYSIHNLCTMWLVHKTTLYTLYYCTTLFTPCGLLYPVFNCASLLSTEVFRKHSEMFDWFGELYHCLLQPRSLIFWTNQNRREFKVLLFTSSWIGISLHCRGDQKNEKKGNINSLKMKKMESKDK